MGELEEYHQNLMADIRREADASGILMVEAFFDRMTERLTEAGELEVADRAFYENTDGGQRIRIDGYAGDPRASEGILGLIVCDFVDADEVRTFSKTDVPPILNPLIRFLKKARTEEFRDFPERGQPGLSGLGSDHHNLVAGHQGQADPCLEPSLYKPRRRSEAGRGR